MAGVQRISVEHLGLSEADVSMVSGFCNRVMDQAVQQNLNLTKLEQVVVCQDFQQKVFQFQRRVGLLQELTNESGCVACAKTIWYRHPQHGMRARIFINADLFLSLGQRESAALGPLSPHLLVHELGHIHDDTCVSEHFGNIEQPSLGDSESISVSVSRCIWGEYFAESLALTMDEMNHLSQSIKIAFQGAFESLRLMQKGTLSDVKTAHICYQKDQDVSSLWSTVVTSSSNHLMAIGRMVPYVEFPLQDTIVESVGEDLGVFGPVTLGLIQELKRLKSLYGQWDAWSWSELQGSVKVMWELCGVQPEPTDTGCKIHVMVSPNEVFR